MFGKLFTRRELAELNAGITYKEARDMHSMAFHIEAEEGKPLCGTTNAMYGNKSVTAEYVIESAPMQHSGWYWCSACAERLTGVPAENFRNARRS